MPEESELYREDSRTFAKYTTDELWSALLMTHGLERALEVAGWGLVIRVRNLSHHEQLDYLLPAYGVKDPRQYKDQLWADLRQVRKVAQSMYGGTPPPPFDYLTQLGRASATGKRYRRRRPPRPCPST